MEIIIHQAILHVLDTTMDAPVLSGSGMEMTAEKTAYFQYHIEKLLASDDIRQCRPLPDSAFKNELEHNHDFVDLSCRIAGVLFDYMHAHTTIPGADLAVVDFTRDGEPWLGILKLNYKNGYTHYTENVEGAPVNSIIQQRACLPSQSGKVEEGALVNLTDYSMKLLEKKFDIDGHKDFYLSTVVFQYTTAQPEKKKLQAIQEAAVQAVQENYADQPHVEAQVAMLIANQAADNDNQVSIQQVRQQLEEEYPLAAVPFDDYVEKSDVLEAPEQPVTVTPARIRRMESRSIHTANGIEVKIPTELLNSDNEVEFLHTDDGSYGTKGVVTAALDELVAAGNQYDLVITIGPLIMMKFVVKTCQKHGLKSIVSMNPIMIDGTGMCGGCRLTVGGETKFACVDGPDFDGDLVDFDEAMARGTMYRPFEAKAREKACNLFKTQEGM